jgi:hypothetical protein
MNSELKAKAKAKIITTPDFIRHWRMKSTPPMEGNFFRFHPPLANEIHPSNGGEFFQISSAFGV